MNGRRLLGGYAVLAYVFLYAPIAVVVVFAFNGSRDVLYWQGLSTKWFHVALGTPEITSALSSASSSRSATPSSRASSGRCSRSRSPACGPGVAHRSTRSRT